MLRPEQLENKDGLPLTAGDHTGWIVLVTAFTLGVAAYALGIFLAFWIRLRRKRGLALALYVYVAAMLAAEWIFNVRETLYFDLVDTSVGLAWIAANFFLRYEIRKFYKATWGVDLEMRVVWTMLFGPIYINYCLNPLVLALGKGPTSLHLSSDQSEKITS